MIRTVLALIGCIACVGCVPGTTCRYASSFPDDVMLYAPPRVRFLGGNGSSVQDAVIIAGATSSAVGVKAEYKWIQKTYPGTAVARQSLVLFEGRPYDVLLLATSAEVQVFFDISAFYGKADAGAWRFVASNGTIYTGNIKDGDLPAEFSKPWSQCIASNSSGILIYQVEDAPNDGLIGMGPLTNGCFDGEWHFWRPLDGLGSMHFRMGEPTDEPSYCNPR